MEITFIESVIIVVGILGYIVILGIYFLGSEAHQWESIVREEIETDVPIVPAHLLPEGKGEIAMND